MKNVMKKARILLVDEDNLYRFLVRHALEKEEGMEIVGECTSAEEALSKIQALLPNIIVMNTLLPGMDGIQACRRLMGKGSVCDVIMLSADQKLIERALTAGAVACFPKDLKVEELAKAIRLTCKWQSLKAANNNSVYSVRQIEAMIMENLATFGVEEQTHDKEKPKRLVPEKNKSSNTVHEVTLAISSPDDSSQLQRFIYRVKETLQVSIMQMVGSWSDTQIVLNLRKPAWLAEVIDELAKMPEVAEVEEKVAVIAGESNFFKTTKPSLRKQILVTLSTPAPLSTIEEPAHQYLELSKLQSQPVGATVR